MSEHDAEKEQRELSKKMRMLEGNRRSYAGDARSVIQKQHDTVTALKKENKKLRDELKSTEESTGLGSKFQASLTGKEETQEHVLRKIDIESRRLRDLENKIDEHQGLLKVKRKERSDTMGGVNAAQESHMLVDKQIKVLENRLDQALVRFNEALSRNKELREEIDSLRRERVVFDGIYRKLEKELHEKKKQMAEIIEKSNLYYEDRDASGVELRHLREAAEKDIHQYERHFEELDLMLEANKNLESTIKSMRTQTKTQTLKGDDDEELGGTRKRKQDKTRQEVQQEPELRTTNYQEIVDQLKEATGIQDMDVLLQKFVKAEEQNFSMYNFVNELNTENELLEEEIEKLKEYTTVERGDAARTKQLKELEEELSKAEGLAETLNDSTIQAKRKIEELQQLIGELFTRAGCSTEGLADTGSADCTESNMMAFLGAIEERANEILSSYNVAKASEMRSKARLREEERRQAQERRAQERQSRREQGDDVAEEEEEDDDDDEPSMHVHTGSTKAKFLGIGPNVPMGATNLAKVVESRLPAAGDSFGVDCAEDGEDERPFSQEELRLQTETRLARQLNKDEKNEKGKKKGKDKHRRA